MDKGFSFITPALRLGLIKPKPVLGFSPRNDIFTGQKCRIIKLPRNPFLYSAYVQVITVKQHKKTVESLSN